MPKLKTEFGPQLARRVDVRSAWNEHIPFAYELVRIMKPEVLVELGVHTGVSFFAFCQAVQELRLKTECVGIDLWGGDEICGFYDAGPMVKEVLSHQQAYGYDFARFVAGDTAMAARDFMVASVDILHVDANHSYDSVRRDFEAWELKLSPLGVVLFHDTQVVIKNCGVKRYWNELRVDYPHFEFTEECGLGVLYVGDTDWVDEEYGERWPALVEVGRAMGARVDEDAAG